MPEQVLTPEQHLIQLRLTAKMAMLGFPSIFIRCETGPIVSQYIFKPLATSPLNKIINRSEDLALVTGSESIIIQRFRDEIYISVPNKDRTIIKFDDALHWLATSQDNLEFILPLLMGQTCKGVNFSIDLANQPHILIAGSTGSGKSVFLAQIIASLAVLKSPQELKFILVDTKQLDLTLFAELDHVVEMVDKIEALYDVMAGLIKEVRRRTELMKGLARNIAEYNKMALNIGDKPLPYYVLVIDELADVIGQDKELAKDEDKDSKRTRISSSLASLAQISRAAGIHIIAATQRPSIKVISGDIKTNFPTRISFKLPTGFDSRVILDENGAESLLGKGDYLYRTNETASPIRAHSSFVTITDIARVIEQHSYIRETFNYVKTK